MNASRNSSRLQGILSEPRLFSLQREIEQMTQSLEFEKRESTYLDEQIKLIQFEIEALPKPSKTRNNELKARISVMERKLDLEVATLNKAKYSNRQLRGQINEYRLDKSAHKQSLNAISDNLGKASEEASQVKETQMRIIEDHEEEQERISKLRAKSANHRSAFEGKISHLTSMLRNTDMSGKISMEEKVYTAQSIEVISVLKTTSRFAQKFSIDKKKNLDGYLKHINSLRSGFESIKTATGINIIEDMVTSCVKSEEQNRQVLSYLNYLNAEIDLLEESLRSYSRKIAALEGSKNRGKLNLEEFKASNEEHQRNLTKKLREKQLRIEKNSDQLKLTLPILKQIFSKILKIDIKGLKISNIDLNSIEKLNQETASLLLGNIEDFIINLSIISDFENENFSNHLKDTGKHSSGLKTIIKELLEEKELYDEPGFDEIKAPITVEDMKSKAVMLYQSRKSSLRSKPNTPDAAMARTSKYILPKEQKSINRIQAL